MTDWIPVSERLPTEADAPISGPNEGKVEVTTHQGEIEIMEWDSTAQYAAAWRRLPEPYVPPEKPNRSIWWVVVRFDFSGPFLRMKADPGG